MSHKHFSITGSAKKAKESKVAKEVAPATTTTAPVVTPQLIDKMDYKPVNRKLSDSGVFYISEAIEPNMSRNVVSWIFEENMKENRDYDHLTLVINSPGGYVTAGFAIIDAMRGSKIPVHTVAMGEIASMGLLIFMSGEKGHRVVAPHTMIMSHQFAGGSVGKQHELLASTKRMDITGKHIMEHYKEITGLSKKEIKKFLLSPSDHWLTPEEAVKYNLADEVRSIGG